MPYTLAHPALVVPLRRWLVLGAAVAGAMAPDVGYYLPTWLADPLHWPGTDVTHSYLGAVGFDAVVGLVMYALWRWPVREPALGSLPEPWRGTALETTAEVLPGRSVPVRALLVYLSCALGSVTHVFVDVFTHERPDTPDLLIDDTVFGLPIASQLQRGLSVLGLLLIAWWVVAWAREVAPLRTFSVPPRLALLLAVVVVGGVVGALARVHVTAPTHLGAVVVESLFGSGWGAALGLLAAALVLRAGPAATPDSQVSSSG